MDCSLPSFSVRGILQARILEWVTISFFRGSSRPRDRTQDSLSVEFFRQEYCSALPFPTPGVLPHPVFPAYPALTGGVFTRATWEKKEKESEVAQLCLTLGDPLDCSLPGSSVHGILQARILEWVAISFSRGSS